MIDFGRHDKLPRIFIQQTDDRLLDFLFRDDVAMADQHLLALLAAPRRHRSAGFLLPRKFKHKRSAGVWRDGGHERSRRQGHRDMARFMSKRHPKCLQSKGFKAQTSKESAIGAVLHKAVDRPEVNWRIKKLNRNNRLE